MTALKKWLWLFLAGAAVIAVGVALAVWVPWRGGTESLQSVRFEVAQSDAMRFIYGGAMAVSPDGHWLVFPARGEDGVVRYWVRSLDTVEARPLPGTERAYVPAAWTSDSRYVIFSPLGDGTPRTQVMKVDIQGGPPQVLGEMLGALNGATSSKEGVILFGSSMPGAPVSRVPAAGGAVVPVTAVAEGDTGHKFPQFLPDGRRFLYLRVSPDPDKMGVYVGSIDAKPDAQSPQRLLATNRQAYYAARSGGGSGHLIFLRDGTLMAQPFDPDRLTLSGEAASIAEGVESFSGQLYGLFSVSDTGTLAYRTGAGEKLSVTWLDQKGRLEGVLGDPGEYANPAVSPDASRIAVALGRAGARDIWIVDAGNTARQFTFDPANDDNPVWSPDGTTIAFSSNRQGPAQLYMKPADGLGEERLVSDQPGLPTSWSKDGRHLLLTVPSAKTLNEIWVLPDPVRGDAKPIPLIATESNNEDGQFSPDGRWIAYTSRRPNIQVYVRPFSPNAIAGATAARYLVFRGLSSLPRWRADGARLFFATGIQDLMAVDVNAQSGFLVGTPQRLFTAPPPLTTVGWSLAPAGDRFLFITTLDGGKPAPYRVVVNWATALNR